jgi:hypothetical protein
MVGRYLMSKGTWSFECVTPAADESFAASLSWSQESAGHSYLMVAGSGSQDCTNTFQGWDASPRIVLF